MEALPTAGPELTARIEQCKDLHTKSMQQISEMRRGLLGPCAVEYIALVVSFMLRPP